MTHTIRGIQRPAFLAVSKSTHNLDFGKTSAKNESGQSTVEFLLSLSIVLGIIFLFFKLALNMTNGYLVHYATFMASRTYLVSDSGGTPINSEQQAGQNALDVLSGFKAERLIGSPLNSRVHNNGPSNKKLYSGISTTFSSSFSMSNFIGGNKPLNLISESFLGREPSRSNCLIRICKVIELLPTGGTTCAGHHITAFDNGC